MFCCQHHGFCRFFAAQMTKIAGTLDADLSYLAIFQSLIVWFKKKTTSIPFPFEYEPNAVDFCPKQQLIKLIGNSGNHLQIIYSFQPFTNGAIWHHYNNQHFNSESTSALPACRIGWKDSNCPKKIFRTMSFDTVSYCLMLSGFALVLSPCAFYSFRKGRTCRNVVTWRNVTRNHHFTCDWTVVEPS